MTRTRVVITGLGCISPLGNDVSSTWAAILAGRSGVGPITLFDATGFDTRFAAEVKGFDPVAHLGRKLARHTDRFAQFALVAAAEALQHAGAVARDPDRTGVLIGSGIGGVGSILTETERYLTSGPKRVSPFLAPMMLQDSASGQVAIRHGLRGPNMSVATACATGSNAIGEAAEMIRRGSADAMLAGGAEAAIVTVALAGFNAMDAISERNDDPQHASRPFDLDRDGFVVAEGGAVLVLESLDHARARGATPLAELIGYGTTNDAFHISAPAENGSGAAACMALALKDASLTPEDIDYINAHGTSTKLNDASETRAIRDVFGRAADHLPVSSTKSMTGHLMGAAGALEAIFCVLALRDGILPPTTNYTTPDPACDLDYVPNQARPASVRRVLSNSFGFGGHNASLILSRVEAP